MSDEITDEKRTEKLHKLVCADVGTRQQWLTRQNTFYVMRHDGIRRQNKPWAHATDLHFPLVDSIIEKFKPFYANQLFGTEVLGQFAASDPNVAAFAQETGYWFDFKLKQRTNLEEQMLLGIDKMLMAGHVPMRIGWDSKEQRMFFDAIEPTHCIVPDGTEDTQDADRITIVHHLTPGAYRRDARFLRKDEEFIQSITGAGGASTGGTEELKQSKERREGITHGGKDSDLIIVWEMWEQTANDGWWVHFISPLAPDQPLRASQRNPFTHKQCPIVRFDVEIKDKGWYASRGVPEKIGAFERWLCRMWNEKGDSMALYNRPIFGSTSPIPNAGNLQMRPGQIIPGLTAAFTAGRPPFSFDEEMQATRGVAEQTIGTPDYGIGENDNIKQPRTLGEIKLINQQHGTGIDLRSRVFRLALGRMLQLAWVTLLQYDKDTEYYVGEQVKQLPQAALQTDAWKVMPNGSSDSWNKDAMVQKAIMRKQLFANSPWINQPELDKSILELDDPRQVPRLFMDPNEKQRNEYEDEALKIPTLMLGMPLQGDPGEDQPMRIKCLMDFLHQRGHVGAPVDPLAVKSIMARIQVHLAVLKQKDPKAALGIAQAIDAETQKHAANVVQMQPGGGAPALPAPEAAAPVA